MDQSIAVDEKNLHQILVWMPHWLGDVVFALLSVQALRVRFPHARITAVCHSPAHEILSNHPSIDSVIKIPFTPEDGWRPAFSFARSLKKYNFDLAVLFPNSFRSAVLSWLSGARIRIGYDTGGRGFLLTHAIPVRRDSKSVHATEYYSEVISCLGIDQVANDFQPVLTPEEVAQQGEWLERQGVYPKDIVMAIQPGASKPEKRWHAERFGILCQKLIKEYDAKILLLGSTAEKELIAQVEKFCPREHSLTFIGKDLQAVLALLRNCRLLIANDSGLMHLAAMVGTPVVGIFGPGSPKTTDPCIDSSKKEIVSLNFSCSPCRHKFFKECEPSPHHKPFCIENISVKDVSEAVGRLLEKIQ
ncbi:MAG: lipopolysaccharide heptosyltransferase II [Nitrospinota bacterium]|nr:lipopolysaccharide heptosyltransferase II [Nitrospinota bacterium]